MCTGAKWPVLGNPQYWLCWSAVTVTQPQEALAVLVSVTVTEPQETLAGLVGCYCNRTSGNISWLTVSKTLTHSHFGPIARGREGIRNSHLLMVAEE